MVTVENDRCAYCGGCVPVCPVGALTLQETRLTVDGSCTACGRCLAACAAGALRLEDGTPSVRVNGPAERYDVVVVGAGPGGATAAYVAAKAGLSVLMLEKRQEIGSPVRCAEGVGQEQLTHFIDPEPRWIAAQVNSARITAIRGGKQQEFSAIGGRGYVLERRVFDRVLAERAALAGADVRVKTAATGLLLADGAVYGVKVAAALPGVESAVEAAVVIGADGVEAQTARWSGLATALPLADTMVCAQYLLAGIDIDPTCTCYTIDWATAPGGYAWVFPKGERAANVGLGVQADLCDAPPAVDSAGQPTHPDVLGRLIQFIEADRRLAAGSPVTLVLGNVPVAAGIKRKVASGLILVGDAARQVDPLTGGGITNAMAAGQLAAEVAVAAIAAGDTSARFLHRYEERWQVSIGRKMARNYRLRQRFPPEQRGDERFVQAFALAVGG